jgi:phosphoglycerol transferase MdoB-like AlkP superfamily enzyme
MTTSNHPPFSINLQEEGFDIAKTTQLLDQYHNTTTNVKELGHIWYADKAIGEFVSNMTALHHNVLFAITGDHFGRKHILPNPPLFDVSAVPLILYGNNIQDHYEFHPHVAGSHLDLGATLIELIAPKGFNYYALGNNLFSPSKHFLGIGQQRIITSKFIASTTSQEIMYLQHDRKNIAPKQFNLLKQQHDQTMDIAWWMIKKGDHYEKNK